MIIWVMAQDEMKSHYGDFKLGVFDSQYTGGG